VFHRCHLELLFLPNPIAFPRAKRLGVSLHAAGIGPVVLEHSRLLDVLERSILSGRIIPSETHYAQNSHTEAQSGRG
jgi:hypothetical protein